MVKRKQFGDEQQSQEQDSNPMEFQQTGGLQDQAAINRMQKQLRLERTQQTPLYDLIQQLKKKWESLRIKHIPKKQRQLLVADTLKLVQGHLEELIFKHDASRIVQSLLKYSDCGKTGGQKQSARESIISELLPHFVKMSQTAYARFIVLKALKYAPDAKWRNLIIDQFVFASPSSSSSTNNNNGKGARNDALRQVPSNKIVKLLRHKYSSVVIDTIYCVYANSQQRQCMADAFYGSEYLLTKRSMLLMQTPATGKTVQKIDMNSVLVKFPEKKVVILKQFRDTLVQIAGKDGAIGSSELVHRVLLEYLQHLELTEIQALYSDEQAPFRTQFVKDLASIVHTKHGAQIAMTVIRSAGTAKDRKQIVKAMKSYVSQVAQNEYGWMVIVCILSCVDDTVLVKQSIVSELMDDLDACLRIKNMQKVILHLLSGNSTKYFSPAQIEIMDTRSEFVQITSKKDPQVRRRENLDNILPKVIDSMLKDHNDLLKEIIFGLVGTQMMFELMQYLQANDSAQYTLLESQIAKLISEDAFVWPTTDVASASAKTATSDEDQSDSEDDFGEGEDIMDGQDEEVLQDQELEAEVSNEEQEEDEVEIEGEVDETEIRSNAADLVVSKTYLETEERSKYHGVHLLTSDLACKFVSKCIKQMESFGSAISAELSRSGLLAKLKETLSQCEGEWPSGVFFVLLSLCPQLAEDQKTELAEIVKLASEREINSKGISMLKQQQNIN
ncbi:hypothetical protein MP228_003773 [Amoeboaphelidium protococcarum]|nr:hypothetical protein MP228_003773 [Amoeboaphelidium protococcarum]